MFGFTYVYIAFSKMNFIKNNFRSRLTGDHLNDLMKISCTNLTPHFKKFVKIKNVIFTLKHTKYFLRIHFFAIVIWCIIKII